MEFPLGILANKLNTQQQDLCLEIIPWLLKITHRPCCVAGSIYPASLGRRKHISTHRSARKGWDINFTMFLSYLTLIVSYPLINRCLFTSAKQYRKKIVPNETTNKAYGLS